MRSIGNNKIRWASRTNRQLVGNVIVSLYNDINVKEGRIRLFYQIYSLINLYCGVP